jgi:hypothetical protein
VPSGRPKITKRIGTELNKTLHFSACADEVNLLGGNMNVTKENKVAF